jgi:hypothetical protein
MSDYDVGYGRPPRHSQFKKGVCPNPRGRGKRGDLQIGEIMKRVLNATTEFRDHGKVKKASRLELSVRRLAASAAKGDIGSAAWLLKLRAHAEKYRDAGPTIITIVGGLPPPPRDLLWPTPEPMRSTKADRCAGDRSASDAGQECAGSSAPVPGEHGDSGPTIIRVAGGFPDAFRRQ